MTDTIVYFTKHSTQILIILKQFILNLDKTGILLFSLLNILLIWLFSMVAQLASGSYYDFSLIVIGIGIPAILLFLIFLSLDPKKSLFLFILIFPIFPSIHNYLSTFGSKLVPALIELVISFLLFFAISIKHKSSRQLNSITYFSIFWVFANSVSLMISGFEEPALVGYILSLAFLFMAL